MSEEPRKNNEKEIKGSEKRPISCLSVFFYAAKVIKDNFLVLFVGAIGFTIISWLVTWVGQFAIGLLTISESQDAFIVSYGEKVFSLPELIALTVFGILIYLLIISIPTVGFITLSLKVLRSQNTTLSVFFKKISLVPKLFLATALKYLFLSVIFAGFTGLGFLVGLLFEQGSNFVIFLFSLVGIIASFYFFMKFYFFNFFLVDKATTPVDSLRLSYEKTEDAPVFIYLIFLAFITMAITLVGLPLHYMRIDTDILVNIIPPVVSLFGLLISFVSAGYFYLLITDEKTPRKAPKNKIIITILIIILGMVGSSFYSGLTISPQEEEMEEMEEIWESFMEEEEFMNDWDDEFDDID